MKEGAETNPSTEAAENEGPVSSSRFDYERYRHHLDRLPLSEAARRQIGEAIYAVLSNRVDAAWGDDPVQRLLGVGDRFGEAAGDDSRAVLGSANNQQFERPASTSAAPEEAR